MDTFSGHLDKMKTTIGPPVNYELPLDELRIPLNTYLGRKISLEYERVIHCVACGRKIKKSYQQGHCFPCMRSLASCDMCIVKPELCHYHEGTCREPSWGEKHCMKTHFVYLANSSGIKVGITKEGNIPTRWIDQGAQQAVAIFQVRTRLQSGVLEVLLKDHVADKTDWRKMLRGEAEPLDLIAKAENLLDQCAEGLDGFRQRFGEEALTILEAREPTNLEYPVLDYPQKITSLNFDKTPHISGTLLGIKGQYLILSSGVLNIRKFSGYHVAFSA